ncbi:MgtC/SapB family protein [Longispora albida]|uniref:MgtC/SapB family protein n=1 Tax=Longispora albida TaxID=203523 RepID=UPI001FDFC976|nr:MgtC/SapB family protein [Longispora albida]
MQTFVTFLHVFAAAVLGAVIGLERQWRASIAGIRTNSLVATGSAMFVLLGSVALGGPTRDPTRVAAQIVSGIGFLGAGVILRDGLKIRGLNTAATLWCAAAVGALAGTGQFGLALAGAGVVVATNLVLRPVGQIVGRASERPRRPLIRKRRRQRVLPPAQTPPSRS